MIDRDIFFKAVREKPFGGSLSQEQVDGMNIILDAWDRSGLKDTRWLSIFARSKASPIASM